MPADARFAAPLRGTAFLLLIAGLVACSGEPDAGAAATTRDAAAAEVITAPVTSRPFSTEIEAIGTALARESVQVTSKTTDIVAAIQFDEGQLVKRGAVLVKLDDAEERAAVAEAEAALTDSESQYRRSRDLVSQQALSASQLDTIESTLKANRARLAAARARLDDTLIRAGFDGQTGFRQISVGALVTPGTAITTLDDTAVIKLEFTVPETQLPALRRGLPVTATTAGVPGRRFAGTITNLDSRIDPVSRSLRVRAELPNRDRVLRPGMFMTVRLEGEATEALVVPEQAIVPERGDAFVFVVEEGRAVRRQVHLGRRRPGEVEVLDGIEAGQRVVVEGTQHVADGIAVTEGDRPAPAQAAPAPDGPATSGS